MVKVKSVDEIVKKWSEVTPGRSAYYEAGVRNPREDWAAATARAKDAWSSGIQQAISENRFERGVKKAGTQKWQKGAVEKGVRRWADGIRVATDEYQTGIAPFIDTISRLALPERGAKGDPRNIERVAAIAKALHKKKLELLGGSAGG